MNNSIAALLEETKSKMGGFMFLFKYRLIHFSVKSDPAVLLAVTINIEGHESQIEDLADVIQPNDEQLVIVPHDYEYVVPITAAILRVHPEYKVETKEDETEEVAKGDEIGGMAKGDEIGEVAKGDELEELKKTFLIYCTMPEMNDDRKDAGMDYVKVNFDVANGKLDACKGRAVVDLGHILQSDPQLFDKYTKEIEKIYDQHKKACESVRKEKEEEIAEAYQRYVDKKMEEQAKELREKEAKGEQASQSIKIDSFLAEE